MGPAAPTLIIWIGSRATRPITGVCRKMIDHIPSRPSRAAVLALAMVAAVAHRSAEAQGTRPDYARADRLRGRMQGKVFRDRVVPRWSSDNQRFWYRLDLPGGAREFLRVDADRATRAPAFDHARLASALSKAGGKPVAADRL